MRMSEMSEVYNDAMRVLQLQRWTTLYHQLHDDHTEYLIPLLTEYQDTVTKRRMADQQVSDHYKRCTDREEGERLSLLFALHHQKEIRLFEELTEELYGKPKKPWEVYDRISSVDTGFRYVQEYNTALQVLRLQKWDTLFNKLHTDADTLLPLLLAYQASVNDRYVIDRQLTDHFNPQGITWEEFDAEGDRLNQLFSQQQVEEEQHFATLTKELYGVQKQRSEVHDMK